MVKKYAAFIITDKGKLKKFGDNHYDTEADCFEKEIKDARFGEFVILPIYVQL